MQAVKQSNLFAFGSTYMLHYNVIEEKF